MIIWLQSWLWRASQHCSDHQTEKTALMLADRHLGFHPISHVVGILGQGKLPCLRWGNDRTQTILIKKWPYMSITWWGPPKLTPYCCRDMCQAEYPPSLGITQWHQPRQLIDLMYVILIWAVYHQWTSHENAKESAGWHSWAQTGRKHPE